MHSLYEASENMNHTAIDLLPGPTALQQFAQITISLFPLMQIT